MQKITAPIFEAWMTILTQVPGSVSLASRRRSDDTDARLKALAAQSGVAPERLIFAKKKPNPEHVARYALADLFLDTFPYGAHTTAADAMWMGVPCLDGSRRELRDAGMRERRQISGGIGDLVCADQETYVARAIEFGQKPRDARAAQAEAARRAAVFACCSIRRRLVRDLEDLYRGMWREFQDGRRAIPDLSNLDMYHDIGLDLAVEGASASTPEAYRQLYRDRLETRNRSVPSGRILRDVAGRAID